MLASVFLFYSILLKAPIFVSGDSTSNDIQDSIDWTPPLTLDSDYPGNDYLEAENPSSLNSGSIYKYIHYFEWLSACNSLPLNLLI